MSVGRRANEPDSGPLLELGQMPSSYRTSLEDPFMSTPSLNSNIPSRNNGPDSLRVPSQDSSARQRLISGGGSLKDSGTHVNVTSSDFPSEKRSSFKFLPSGENNWALEISAIVLSVASLSAIIVLLPVFENKPLTQWSFPISFNAVVSILGATSRAALAFAISACISQGKWNWYRKTNDDMMVFDRFEEASRGPWGSVRLLWWTKLRNWTALGALSAVVLVGFEPFLQAIITFSGEEIDLRDSSAAASIGRTQRLDAGLHTYGYSTGANMDAEFPGVGFQGIRSEYDFGALAAIWEGFSNLSSVNNLMPDFSCPTGNCTWDPYATLAVCSSCHDVSEHITQSSGKVGLNDSAITIFHHPPMTIFKNGTEEYPYTRYEIADIDLSISNYHGIARSSVYGKAREDTEDEYGRDSVFMIGAELTARATCNPGKTVSFTDAKTLLISVAVLQASEGYREKRQRWEQSTVTAKECALFFCTNTYQSTVLQGVLNETLLSSDANRNLDSFTSDNLTYLDGFKAYNKHTNYSLYPGPRDAERTDLQLVINKEEYAARTGVKEDDDQRFNISYNTVGSLGRWFLGDFSQYRAPRDADMLAYPTYGEEPPVVRGLATSTNFTTTFENVAASLTKWMRNRSFQTEPFVGTTKQWVVRIRVNWAFLSLPVGALLGGCIFCALSIWETHKLGLSAWRGSSLATLAHGLDNESRALLRGASRGDGSRIADQARTLDVKFVDSNDGLELVQVNRNDDAHARTV